MRPRFLATAIAVATLLAGCASDPPPDQQSSTSVAPTGHGSLAQCLSDQGVPAAPGPAAGPPPGVDAGAWQRAMTACSSLAPGPAG